MRLRVREVANHQQNILCFASLLTHLFRFISIEILPKSVSLYSAAESYLTFR